MPRAAPLPATTEAVPLGAMLEALPWPTLVSDGETRVLAANGHAHALLPALRVGEALALSLRDPDVLDAAGRVAQSGCTETVSWRDRVPVERAFVVTVARIGPAGTDARVVLSLRDTTEARRVERMRADFIANVSHELRTPLASMLGFIETLAGPAREDQDARERFLTIMAEQGRRMARLIDDLLSLSRIEGKLHLRPSAAVDLAGLARHVVETLGPLARQGGVAVAVEAEGAVPVTGDRDDLIRVAENLIENAIKYGCETVSTQPPRIVVEVRREGRDGLLRVRDHGLGIAPHHLPRLTERFYRVDAGKSRAKGGTGLGLALVKHVVARHRGRMTIDSVPAEGTVVAVRLPLHGDAG